MERVVDWQVAADLAPEIVLLQLRQDFAAPTPAFIRPAAGPAGGQTAVGVVVEMQGYAELLLVVPATGGAGRLAGKLHRGQDQADENANDGNHDQQLHNREAGLTARHG